MSIEPEVSVQETSLSSSQSYSSSYVSLIGPVSSTKRASAGRPSSYSVRTSTLVTPSLHSGYDGRSAMTAMTAAGSASMTMLLSV